MQNNNQDVIEALQRSGKIESKDLIPNMPISKIISPVFDVTPRVHRVCNVIRNTTATYSSATIYTTPTDKDFYLVFASYTIAKDATSDSPTGESGISITIEGQSKQLTPISSLTTTAINQTSNVSMPIPIKIDRGTAITINGLTGSLGVIYRGATIVGYTVETQ